MEQGKVDDAQQVRQRALRALVNVQRSKDAKPAGIDEKIERILKDVEELRREIQREKSQKATPPAGGKSMLLPGSPPRAGVKVLLTEDAAKPAGKKIELIDERNPIGLRIRIAEPTS